MPKPLTSQPDALLFFRDKDCRHIPFSPSPWAAFLRSIFNAFPPLWGTFPHNAGVMTLASQGLLWNIK